MLTTKEDFFLLVLRQKKSKDLNFSGLKSMTQTKQI